MRILYGVQTTGNGHIVRSRAMIEALRERGHEVHPLLSGPELTGRWSIEGYQVGKGSVYGEFVVTEDPGTPDGFKTETRYTYARTGEKVTRTGQAVVFTAFQWRGRSGVPGADAWREAMFVERDWKEMSVFMPSASPTSLAVFWQWQ